MQLGFGYFNLVMMSLVILKYGSWSIPLIKDLIQFNYIKINLRDQAVEFSFGIKNVRECRRHSRSSLNCWESNLNYIHI